MSSQDKELKRLLYDAKLLLVSGQTFGHTDPGRVKDWLRQFNAILPPTSPFIPSHPADRDSDDIDIGENWENFVQDTGPA